MTVDLTQPREKVSYTLVIADSTAETRPTQPPTLCGTENKYPPNCIDALCLGVKAGSLIPRVGDR